MQVTGRTLLLSTMLVIIAGIGGMASLTGFAQAKQGTEQEKSYPTNLVLKPGEHIIYEPSPRSIPLLALLITPERYEGKWIGTIGYVRSGFEQHVVYNSREDAAIGNYTNGVWLSGPVKSISGGNDINGKYCLIEGTFTAKEHGHLGLYNGGIKNINRVVVWDQPRTNTNKEETPPPK